MRFFLVSNFSSLTLKVLISGIGFAQVTASLFRRKIDWKNKKYGLQFENLEFWWIWVVQVQDLLVNSLYIFGVNCHQSFHTTYLKNQNWLRFSRKNFSWRNIQKEVRTCRYHFFQENRNNSWTVEFLPKLCTLPKLPSNELSDEEIIYWVCHLKKESSSLFTGSERGLKLFQGGRSMSRTPICEFSAQNSH